jgi:hypothetical protein
VTWPERIGRTAAAGGLLFLALAAAAAETATSWPDERRAGQFHCHADFSLAGQQALLAELAQLASEISSKLGAPRSREAVHLFLFEAKGTYEAYLKQHFPRVPARRALFIKARGPGMVFAFYGDEFDIDVRHECTHALLHTWLPQVPLWLDEGLAEYFEVPRDCRVRRHPHHELVQAAVRIGQLPRLEGLESLERIDEMGREQYRDAWAWVHFMLHGPREAHEELTRYLAEISAGSDPGRLSERLRRRLPDLDRRVAEHFRS